MCQSRAKITFILLIFLPFLYPNLALAQTNTSSNPLAGRENNPYSRYGIGELWNANTTELKGIGNATSAYASPFELNPANPASYAFLQRTTIESGAMASQRTISSSDLSYNTGTMTMSYLNIGMPMGKNGGLCFGLQPISRTYFSIVDTIYNSPFGIVERSYNGTGSLNFAFLGFAHKFNNLSIGVNVGYLFGTLKNDAVLYPIDTMAINRGYTSDFSRFNQIGGILWKAGFMYQHKLPDSNYLFRIGGTFSLKQNVTQRLDAYNISMYAFGDTTVNDTTYNPGEQKGKLIMPMSYSIGILLAKNDVWDVTADYEMKQWSDFHSTIDNTISMNIAKQASKFSVGYEYSPVLTKIHKHYSRITYRLGMYYGNDYLSINNTQLNFYGFTVGGSLHFKATRFSWVNLHTAFDVGRLGTTQNNLIQQTYVRWSIGLSFNDKWFIPRKYD